MTGMNHRHQDPISLRYIYIHSYRNIHNEHMTPLIRLDIVYMVHVHLDRIHSHRSLVPLPE
jgi:hypothetical protein